MVQTIVFNCEMVCGGCSGATTKILNKVEGVTNVDANIETQKITVTAEDGVDKNDLLAKLESPNCSVLFLLAAHKTSASSVEWGAAAKKSVSLA